MNYYIEFLKNKKYIFSQYVSSQSKRLHDRFGTKYLIIVSVALCFIIGIAGATAVVLAEQDAPGASLTDFWNALYWTFSTFSTVGYGDFYPVTPAGKIIANVIMALGIGLYSFAISLITGLFIHNLINKSADNCELRAQNERIEAKMDLVLNRIGEYEKQQVDDRRDIVEIQKHPRK